MVAFQIPILINIYVNPGSVLFLCKIHALSWPSIFSSSSRIMLKEKCNSFNRVSLEKACAGIQVWSYYRFDFIDMREFYWCGRIKRPMHKSFFFFLFPFIWDNNSELYHHQLQSFVPTMLMSPIWFSFFIPIYPRKILG